MSLKNIEKIIPETKKTVKHCKTHGQFNAMQTKSPSGRWVGGKCPTCQANAKEAKSASKIKSMIKPLKKRYVNASFDNYILSGDKRQKSTFDACMRYRDNFQDRLETGGGLILYGRCGTGKTHIACAVGNHVVNNNIADCLYIKVYDLFDSIKESWNSREPTKKVMDEYTKADLLIVDEIGIQYGSDAEKITLFRILDERNDNYKPTIIISNLDENGLIQYLGESVVDRMFDGNGGKLGFTWDSHRRVRA